MDVKNEKGEPQAFSLKFGDIKKFGSTTNEEIASADDLAILPGQDFTFKIDSGAVKYWDLIKRRESFIEPRKARLEHGLTNFGDGTGIEPGGTNWQSLKIKG